MLQPQFALLSFPQCFKASVLSNEKFVRSQGGKLTWVCWDFGSDLFFQAVCALCRLALSSRDARDLSATWSKSFCSLNSLTAASHRLTKQVICRINCEKRAWFEFCWKVSAKGRTDAESTAQTNETHQVLDLQTLLNTLTETLAVKLRFATR